MRAYELYTNTKSNKLTLRHLNRLKHIRRKECEERKAKLAFLTQIYGDAEKAKADMDEERQSLDNLKDEISNMIDAAEIKQQQKSHIENMAMNALKRKNK